MNKSEELAKLLGIEPKYLNIILLKETGHRVALSLEDALTTYKKLSKDDILDKWELVYPDFTNPINFVKLLFLKFKLRASSSMADYVFDREYINNSTKFIDILIQCIEREHFSDEEMEYFKQQAQRTEWEY